MNVPFARTVLIASPMFAQPVGGLTVCHTPVVGSKMAPRFVQTGCAEPAKNSPPSMITRPSGSTAEAK